MRYIIVVFLWWSIPLISNGQCYNRYVQEIFAGVNTVTNIPYGEAVNYAGDTLGLALDFYEPSGDTLSERPLFILLHGPNFVDGDKTDSATVSLAQRMAKRGFVVATINYRLAYSMQTLLEKREVFRASLQAAQDAKAAVRFFRKSMTVANLYKVDTSMIWLGGLGAGAMAVQTAVYLNNNAELSSDWQIIVQEEGGLEGNSGHAGFSSRIRGVLNLGERFSI